MATTTSPDAAGEAARAAEAPAAAPPVIFYLPGMGSEPDNSSTRLAELFQAELSRRPGTYGVQPLPEVDGLLTDGRRLVAADGSLLVDLFTIDYRTRLGRTVAQKTDLLGLLRRAVTHIAYVVRASQLLLTGLRSTRAKTAKSRWQLFIAACGVVAMAVSTIFAVAAIAAALGLFKEPLSEETLVDAIAIGATAVGTLALARLRPVVVEATAAMQMILDYVQDERYAQGVLNILDDALDVVLEDDPDREIYLLGYSLGSLVAIDFLCPRSSSLGRADPRHSRAIRGLVTVGCPLDLVRLVRPEYVDRRDTRVPNLRWTNIFIPADVLGSNLSDTDDNTDTTPLGDLVSIGGIRPTRNIQYTDRKLSWVNVWALRGFLDHGGYWGGSAEGSCIPEIISAVGATEKYSGIELVRAASDARSVAGDRASTIVR